MRSADTQCIGNLPGDLDWVTGHGCGVLVARLE
jgi:hypothetical protein